MRSATPAASRALARHLELLGRDVDRGDMRAGLARKMDGEAAPARADLRDGHAGLQLQLGRGVNELVALRLLQRFMFGIAEIGAGILHVLVEEEPIELGRYVVMMPRMLGRRADRIGLMPAPQRAPDLAHHFLRAVAVERGAIDREQQQEIVDAAALLEGQLAVHISLGGIKLRIGEELFLQRVSWRRAVAAGPGCCPPKTCSCPLAS